MADYTRRERTTTHVEYVLPSPTNWAKLSKIHNAIHCELGPELSQYEDAVQVVTADDQIIFRFVKEKTHG
ncbi:hypothetical protein ACGF0J_21865 [Nonomuraea sp. NPDC047897]|uniref:hypothetical protein n=1 Tax=Nonomuraea sp. NPDC047897 TaxID=3364346 RepID=UPI0037166B2C